jgi:uncharacterized membrane protein
MTKKFTFIFYYLKKENININQNEFNFQIQSHPDYPSLLSISDTLSFFKINNIATRIENEKGIIDTLPDNLISLIDDKESGHVLAFVEKKKIGYQYTKDDKAISISNDEFNEQFANIILIAKKPENEIIKSENKNTLFFSLPVLTLIYLSSIFLGGFYISSLIFFILAGLGVYLSAEAISHEFGINTKLSSAVCNITTSSNCDAVINSTKNKFLKVFSFSELSITFFVAQLLAFLFLSMANLIPEFYRLTLVSLLFSLPLTVYSIYLQKFVAHKWYPICLAIIVLLYAEYKRRSLEYQFFN